MTDIVAELRRLAEKMAQTPLEHAEGHFESIDEMVTYFADAASQRPEHLFLHVVQSVDSVDDGGDGIIAITGNGFLSDVHADVFVAVQRYLPALLDAVDTLRWYADEDNYDPESGAPGQWENVACAPSDPDEWDFEMDCGDIARAALAALKQDGAS